ncbi:BlaI/MecI/CopY family transcriptional regulator [Taibaiella koreensis]|uniref:BlaI/MecI/CopY family transcriptional regulator n=1 Tax=Taibaiella koreensis TaxID=1268548 RepID=UPI000E59AEAE|nr:BlaI/MecI/CopY family transcriptional regulator [Taibaiella koreensis]
MSNFKSLTKAEEQIMQALWKIEQGFTKDIIDQLPEPRPHYNTVSTILKILLEKDFVKVTAMGKSHLYKPVVKKEQYSSQSARHLVKGYFNGSFANMLSFFAREKDISVKELEEILKEIKQNS